MPLLEDLAPTQCLPLLRRHGDFASAFATIQDGLRYFGHPDVGYVAWRDHRGIAKRTAFVFGRPVCAEGDRPALLAAFLERIQPRRPAFVAIDRGTAEILVALGLGVVQVGTEFDVPLATFKVAGRSMKNLRRAANLGKQGVVVQEQGWGEVDAGAVRAMFAAWRHSKRVAVRELRFATRPPVFRDEPDVRRFFGYRDGELLTAAFFDPLYRDGEVIGYCANILRRWPTARPAAALDYTLLEAMAVFREEGKRVLALGFAPGHAVEAVDRDMVGVRTVMQLAWKYGGFLYAFQPLAFHKTRFRVPPTPMFACCPRHSALLAGIETFRCVGVV